MNILNIQYNIFSVHAPGPMTFLFILEIFFFNGSFHFTAPLRIRCRVFPYISCFPTWRASLLIFPYQKRHFSSLLNLPASLVAQSVKNPPAMQEMQVRSLSQEDLLEKEMATHSSILAWESPWTEETGRLQFVGLARVEHDWVTKQLPPRINLHGH